MKVSKIGEVSKILFLLVIVLLFENCVYEKEPNKKNVVFKTLNHIETGVNFQNILTENDSLNYFTYSYLYMGGGVSVGDINNDGLIDLFFTGNQVPNKLFLNKGNLKFEDISEKSGVSGDNKWYTGVTMADVNGDGFLDIYCSVSGLFAPRNNELYINQGNSTFIESAKQYGINDSGNSVQSTFFDFDKDGDLDLFVANYPPTKFSSPTFVYSYKMQNVKPTESDHLYRNDDGFFTDVTKESGVESFGLSLSATVGDLNNDGWPDIYVSNDFNSPDFLYMNNQDGTFSEKIKEATNHTAFYGMGVDISDINNDGNLDYFQVDMDAQTNRRKKTNMASMNPKLFWDVVNAGFHYQYMHNCMQLNTGVYSDGIPHFSNISRITGTSSTDWSWGPILADFDNDGYKDLFISNGTRREINNNDYFNKLEKEKNQGVSLLEKSLKIPSEKIDNFMFKNKGGLKFEKVNKKWGIEYKGFSNGVVYADLDNDGDLEIITNNIDDYVSIFENHSANINNYLKVKFKGSSNNKNGLGNRVYVKTKDMTQMQELTLTRGFQSSVAPELHFGLHQNDKVEELKVVWTSGKIQYLKNIESNQTLLLEEEHARFEIEKKKPLASPLFAHKQNVLPNVKHQENVYDDFKDQILLPHKMSTLGPALAVGDLNNDGLDDFYMGGSSTYSGRVFYQTENGFEYKPNLHIANDNLSEDVGALIFDADNDGDNDLYVVSGGYEFSISSKNLQDRLYLNNGNGQFSKANASSLPNIKVSGSKAYSADFDKDGKEDILVLGRQTPKAYPMPANSYLLKNNSNEGNVAFSLFNEMMPKEFENLGMATSAVITDYNNDTWLDIIIVGEWMPIRVFKNIKTGFEEVSEELGLTENTTGWWWSINQGDFDNDGDMDYIVGNNGLNYKYKASEDETFDIFVNDFDKDNNKDIVLSYYNEGKQYPLRGRQCSSQQIPAIKKKFKDYESFSEASLVDVYSKDALEAALHYQVKSFASVYMENKGDKFILHQLPNEAQLSSINKTLVKDIDHDGNLDFIIAGNMFNSEVETPRNDASCGLVLKGNGKGSFEVLPASQSGFYAPGDVKEMSYITLNKKEYILIVNNNDNIQFIARN